MFEQLLDKIENFDSHILLFAINDINIYIKNIYENIYKINDGLD